MRILSEPAIVLHAVRWRETSLLVEAFTHHHGRVGLIARGVSGGRKQMLRAALQPMQRVRLDYVLRGELAQLSHAEAGGQASALVGESLLAGLYLCELCLRLLPRYDPQPELFLRFARALDEIAEASSLAWALRRFERDLLLDIGYGLDLQFDADAAPLDPAGRYRIDPERGALRVRDASGTGVGDVDGAALLALAADETPSPRHLRDQRRMLRQMIAFRLGARGLRSWGMLGEFAELLQGTHAPTDDGRE